MKRRCSLRLDLLTGESNLIWQVFDRITGRNGGIARTISTSHQVDPGKIIKSFKDSVFKLPVGSTDQQVLESLYAWGKIACKEIFPDEIQRKLSSYDCGDVLFMVPIQWADFPFELIYLQNSFLGQRFLIGTILNTGISQADEKHYNQKGDLMIIADSSEVLQSVCRERESLKNIAINRKRQVRLILQANVQKLIAEIPGASIVHFAGHSGPDQKYDTAGWRLSEGHYFDTDDIIKIGESPVLPWLVFSNSCDGGRVMINPGLSGIAGAFLSAGVHQVVGPLCKLNDMQAKCCTLLFYSGLFRGKSAAQALTSLRKRCPKEAGLTPLFYRLFGDPRFREPANKNLRTKIVRLSMMVIAFLSLLAVGINHLHSKKELASSTLAPGNLNIKKSGGIVFDLDVGGIIHFSVNLYAPTFIYKETETSHQDKRSGSGLQFDTSKSEITR